MKECTLLGFLGICFKSLRIQEEEKILYGQVLITEMFKPMEVYNNY